LVLNQLDSVKRAESFLSHLFLEVGANLPLEHDFFVFGLAIVDVPEKDRASGFALSPEGVQV